MDSNEWNDVPIFAEDSDDEDLHEQQDRYNYELEKAVVDFVDEPRVHHNVYPDSDSDEEDGIQSKKNRNKIRRGDGNLHMGKIYYNGIAFKEDVLDHALKTGRNIMQYRYDKTKLGFSCDGKDCEWRIYCSLKAKTEKWQVTRFNDLHSCAPNGECKLMKVPVIARLFLHKIREEPDYYMPMKIEELILEKWKISVSRPQCQSARLKALKWIDKEYDEQFERLRDYGAEILVSNPESSVEIETVKNAEGLDVFDKFYVCFYNLKKIWKETCRPIIGVDGCFLRGKTKGQILVAVGRDADNAIYPIAWAVVKVENAPNWLWFVKKIQSDLELGDGDGHIMLSDRQKGLLKAVGLELPKIEHRMCVRHIYGNMKRLHGKKPQMKPLIWNIAWSYNEAEYKENLDKLRCYDTSVYEDVMKTNPKSWSRAFFKIGNYCEDVDNNPTESFNSTIVKAREMPLVPMLETITRLAMRYIKKLQIVRSIEAQTRCEHAYGVILKLKLNAEECVNHWFMTHMWRKTYTEGLNPVRGAKFWPCGSGPLVRQPPPPEGEESSKKKEKRKKGINESPVKKQPKLLKRIMHCKICGVANHNSRFHKKSKQGSQGEHSQGEPSQETTTQEARME